MNSGGEPANQFRPMRALRGSRRHPGSNLSYLGFLFDINPENTLTMPSQHYVNMAREPGFVPYISETFLQRPYEYRFDSIKKASIDEFKMYFSNEIPDMTQSEKYILNAKIISDMASGSGIQAFTNIQHVHHLMLSSEIIVLAIMISTMPDDEKSSIYETIVKLISHFWKLNIKPNTAYDHDRYSPLNYKIGHVSVNVAVRDNPMRKILLTLLTNASAVEFLFFGKQIDELLRLVFPQ